VLWVTARLWRRRRLREVETVLSGRRRIDIRCDNVCCCFDDVVVGAAVRAPSGGEERWNNVDNDEKGAWFVSSDGCSDLSVKFGILP